MPIFDDGQENRSIDPSNQSDANLVDGSPDEAMDANQLAALIDGRLRARERESLVASIGAADAAAVLTDAMVALADIGDARPADRARRRPHPGVWLALAAAIAGTILIPVAWLHTRRAPVGPERYAVLITEHRVRMPTEWDDTPWDVTRGAAELSPKARAFRIGVRVTDLGMAIRQGSPTTSRYATEIAALVDQVPGAGPVSGRFRAIASTEAASVARVDSATHATLSLPDADVTRLGAWVEAARLAAVARDVQFFAQSGSLAPPSDSLSSRLPVGVQEAITAATLGVHDAIPGAWQRLADSLTAFAMEAGR